jgi:hypothetical protein
MEQKIIANVPVTNDSLQTLIKRLLKDNLSNKEDYIRVITETFQNSEPACRYLFKVHLGEQLPDIPEIGAVGFIHVDKVGWNRDKDAYKNSEYCRHGYIPCTVKEYRGLGNYSPLVVSIPDTDNKEQTNDVYCDLTDFYEDI